jgi:hypothetical protein
MTDKPTSTEAERYVATLSPFLQKMYYLSHIVMLGEDNVMTEGFQIAAQVSAIFYAKEARAALAWYTEAKRLGLAAWEQDLIDGYKYYCHNAATAKTIDECDGDHVLAVLTEIAKQIVATQE